MSDSSSGSPIDDVFRQWRDQSTEDEVVLEEGATVGDFRLIHRLGSGGMGAVWEAEQLSLKRRVALKLLKPQFRFSPTLLARFQREAEAGGRLQHIGIVQTYGVGESNDIHWIAQELIPGGRTLATHLTAQRTLSEVPADWYRETADLFASLAEALEAAHQAGVIHRDIKPSNILLGEDQQPKIADFGLAQIQDDFELSRTGEFLGTPFYMSPEQALAKRAGLDHRSDIFSLGATLYEALTLVRAFDGDTSQQVFHKIVTEEPVDPRQIRSRVPRDLAVICGKCLEKNPDKRYATMAELAADLRRHLADEPILARPPGAMMRAVKWCRRHPVIAVSGTVATIALATISVLALRISAEQDRTETALVRALAAEASAKSEASRALAAEAEQSRQRELAEQRADELQQVTDFQSEQLQSLDAEAMGWGARQELFALLEAAGNRRKLTPEAIAAQRESLERGLVGLDFTGLGLNLLDRYFFSGALEAVDGFEDQPLVQAQLLQTMGAVLRDAGLLEQAEEPQRRALEIRRSVLGGEHPDTLRSISSLGVQLLHLGKLPEAEALFREVLEGRIRTMGDGHPSTISSINNLAGVLQTQGKLPEAETLLREVLEWRLRILGDEYPDTLLSIHNLGVVLQKQGKLFEAEQLIHKALEAQRHILGEDHPHSLASIHDLGVILQNQGKLSEAELLSREALMARRRMLGGEHPDTLSSINLLARILNSQGKLTESETLFRECLDVRRRILGDEHPDTLASVYNLGGILLSMEKLAEAETLLRDGLEVQRRILGDEHPDTLAFLGAMSGIFRIQGKLTESELLVREELEARRRILGEEHPDTLSSINDLGTLLMTQGKLTESEPLIREALEARRRILGEEHPATLVSINNLGGLLRYQGRYPESEPLLREVLEVRRRILGNEHPDTQLSIHHLGVLLIAMGELSEAETLFREVFSESRRTFGDGHSRTLVASSNIGQILLRKDDFAGAELVLTGTLENCRRALGDGHQLTQACLEGLAHAYLGMQQPARALPLVRELLEHLDEESPDYAGARRLLEEVKAAIGEVQEGSAPEQ